jgi:hypothetical protein
MNRRGFISKALIGAFASLLPFRRLASRGAVANLKTMLVGKQVTDHRNLTFHYGNPVPPVMALDSEGVAAILRKNKTLLRKIAYENKPLMVKEWIYGDLSSNPSDLQVLKDFYDAAEGIS